jgi:hypothetical protein
VGKPEERDHLKDPDVKWENNIKMDLHEEGCGAWIGLI